eukprot:1160330-Pelagomonas_calceolata.AAC.5
MAEPASQPSMVGLRLEFKFAALTLACQERKVLAVEDRCLPGGKLSMMPDLPDHSGGIEERPSQNQTALQQAWGAHIWQPHHHDQCTIVSSTQCKPGKPTIMISAPS